MSHQALFSAVLSLEKPLLTSLTASSASSPIPTTIPTSIPSSSSKSSKSSKSSTTKSKSKSSSSSSPKSRRPSISSDSDSSFTSTFTQRKRKYADDQEVPGDTPLNKKLRRQQQNRQAAHTSRIKKKMQMDALQQQVTDLIAANRLLQEKVTALQSEVASNRALLQDESSISTPITDVSTPISHHSPISNTESPSPESPISPIPITMKSPISPLSDSDASMDTSSSASTSTSLPTSDLISTSLPTSTSTSTSTSPSLIDVIPSSTRCYQPAVLVLSPQCQQMENGILSMNKSPSPSTPSISQPLTWSQFTMILCILNTAWSMIQSSMNTCRLKNIPSPISLIKSLHQNPPIQVHNPIQNLTSIHHPLTSRMSGIEADTNTNHCMSNLCAMMLIMAMSRVTQQSSTTVS